MEKEDIVFKIAPDFGIFQCFIFKILFSTSLTDIWKFAIYLFADCLWRTERADFLVLSFEMILTNPCYGPKLLNQIELKNKS